jgi:response regulator RpfG family c-di-GMP phosphodiesterase
MPPADLPRILCVDDEPNVLEGLALTLRKRFRVVTAPGGERALELLAQDKDFPVVMSDMRMPGMDGAKFLARVRMLAPDSVRVLLTGHAELQAAISAVNDGQIFRFLTKPCPPETLLQNLDGALAQYRLVVAERELLEKTLRGSVAALTDVLALVQPAAFGQATRVKRLAQATASVLGLQPVWPLEMAALLFSVGYVLLPQKTAEKLVQGVPLEGPEKAMADKAPGLARQILGKIPRLEPVTDILEYYMRRFDGQGQPPADPMRGDTLPLGARILRVAVDYDQLDRGERERVMILKIVRSRAGVYDPAVVDALERSFSVHKRGEVVTLPLKDLTAGMVLADDVLASSGMLLVARGHEITAGTLARMLNFAASIGVREPIQVLS